MSKTVWQGSISFGLVNIPIELYSAIESHSLGFKLLHDKCHNLITYKRWCEYCNKEVAWDQIVKGIKLPNGEYFVITEESLKKLKPPKSDYLNILEFVDQQEIVPIYYESHYYITPGKKEADKAFFLFAASLSELNKVAIGKFTMHQKDHVCSIQPYKNGLLLSTLNYSYEIRKNDKLEKLVPVQTSAEEMRLAESIIKKLYKKKFDLSKFKDEYAQKLIARINEKAKGIKPKKTEKPSTLKAGPSLIEALKSSLKSGVLKSEQPADKRVSR